MKTKIITILIPRRIKASEEKAMLNDSGRKTFQEILSEKMEKIAVLEKEIYKRN